MQRIRSEALSLRPVIDQRGAFTKNHDRLLENEIAAKFLRAVLDQPRVKALLSEEYFSVDGTLIEAWAGIKSLRPKGGSGEPPAPGRNGGRQIPIFASC